MRRGHISPQSPILSRFLHNLFSALLRILEQRFSPPLQARNRLTCREALLFLLAIYTHDGGQGADAHSKDRVNGSTEGVSYTFIAVFEGEADLEMRYGADMLADFSGQ